MATTQKEFGFFRSFFWPVRKSELTKLIPMLLICFCIGFNYYLVRSAKDALVITAGNSGAEVIPFIYVWGILPAAFGMTMVYNKLINSMAKNSVFYVMISIFISFFVAFMLILYPFQEQLRPIALTGFLTQYLPAGFSGLISMITYWPLTAFYVMSELWGTLIFYLVFMGFANDVTRVSEAKRFYGLFLVGTHLAGMVAGKCATLFASLPSGSFLVFNASKWTYYVMLVSFTFIVVGFVIMALFRYLTKTVVPKQEIIEEKANSAPPKKIKMSMRENFRFVAQSKYLLFLAMTILMYYTTINLTDVLWKNKAAQLYSDPVVLSAFMGKITMYTSVIATTMALFITGNVIRRFGWLFTAMITPILLLVTTSGFFGFLIFENQPWFLGDLSPLAIAVFFGSMQTILCRASKYTLFDPTKEMAFIPLDEESRLKGKAAIDGVGTRLGKSMGSMVYQFLFLFFPTLNTMTPFVAILVFCILVIWIYSAMQVGSTFKDLTAESLDSTA